jgi:hypothetical protein
LVWSGLIGASRQQDYSGANRFMYEIHGVDFDDCLYELFGTNSTKRAQGALHSHQCVR